MKCPKCGKWELSDDGVCDLCSLVGEIFTVCGPEAVKQTRAFCDKLEPETVENPDEGP